MALIKQGPGKIDWCDYTWNPIQGYCYHECEYCYMKSFWKRFEGYRENKINIKSLLSTKFPQKTGKKIFVGSSTDIFGNWVDNKTINSVLQRIFDIKNHHFLFLTKNPLRYQCLYDFNNYNNLWFGTSVDGTEQTQDNLKNLFHFHHIGRSAIQDNIKFVSFEPLIKPIEITPEFKHYFKKLDWVIFGVDSRKGAEKPPRENLYDLIKLANKYGIPVWIKDNFIYPDKNISRIIIKKFPWSFIHLNKYVDIK